MKKEREVKEKKFGSVEPGLKTCAEASHLLSSSPQLHVHPAPLFGMLCHAPFGATDAPVTGAGIHLAWPRVTVSIFAMNAILVQGAL